jgi:hypothetical protein
MASSYTKAQLIPNDSKDTKADIRLIFILGFFCELNIGDYLKVSAFFYTFLKESKLTLFITKNHTT